MVSRHSKELETSGEWVNPNIIKDGAYNKEKLNKDIFCWLAKDRLPFRTVESPHFKKIVERLGGSLLGRTQLVDTYLPIVLNKTIASVQKVIGGKDIRYSIRSDGWSTSCNKAVHWSSTTIHFIDAEWELQQYLLDIGELGSSANAAKISAIWDFQIEKWKLPVKKLMACTIWW